MQQLDFEFGQSDLKVPLKIGASLDAVVLVGPRFDPAWISLRLNPSTGAPRYPRRFSGKQGQLLYRWLGLPSGTSRMEILVGEGRQPVLTVNQIALVAGRHCDDPRLLNLDLRDAVHPIRVSLTSPGTVPLRDGTVLFGESGPSGYPETGVSIRGLSVMVPLRQVPGNIVVSVPGYEVKRLAGVSGDVKVRLVRIPPIVIRVRVGDAPIVVPTGVRAQLNVRPTVPSQRARLKVFGAVQRSLDDILGRRAMWIRIDPEGTAEAMISTPGEYLISLNVRGRRTAHVGTFGPVTVGKGRFLTVQFSAADLAAALRRAAKD